MPDRGRVCVICQATRRWCARLAKEDRWCLVVRSISGGQEDGFRGRRRKSVWRSNMTRVCGRDGSSCLGGYERAAINCSDEMYLWHGSCRRQRRVKSKKRCKKTQGNCDERCRVASLFDHFCQRALLRVEKASSAAGGGKCQLVSHPLRVDDSVTHLHHPRRGTP